MEPLPIRSRFPPPVPSFSEKAQARGVCVHAGLGGTTSSGSSSVLICVHTSLLLLNLSTILSFREISSLASMTLHQVFFLWLPGCSRHNGTWPRGKWRMKSSLLCSSSPMPWPSLCLLLLAPSLDSHKDAVWSERPSLPALFSLLPLFLLFSGFSSWATL